MSYNHSITMKPFLSVIIPAHNEAERLPVTLIDIDNHLSRAEYSSEIIIVDDGSTDDTATIVEKFSHTIPTLRLVKGEGGNNGKGNAVRRGMRESKGNVRLFMDADNATRLIEFDNFLQHFKSGYSIVIGSRAIRGAVLTPPQSFIRRMFGQLGSLLVRLLRLTDIHDTQCGFKCYSEEAANDIFSRVCTDGWGFDIETLALGERLGYRIKEVPIRWAHDNDSKVHSFDYIATLVDVFRIRLMLWRDAYKLTTKNK